MEEVRVFLRVNNTQQYFKLEETTGVVEITANRKDAAIFTLKTTPELHKMGQFQLMHTSNGSASVDNEQQSELVMKLDLNSEYLTQDGPFKLHASSTGCNDVLQFEIRGRSTELPSH